MSYDEMFTEEKPKIDPWDCDCCHRTITLFFPLLYDGKQICPLCSPREVFGKDFFPNVTE